MQESQNTSFFTKENITFLIAVVGFLLSLWNFIKDLWCNRSSINISFKGQVPIDSLNDTGLRIELAIENKSRIPISISRMFLIYNGSTYEFEWIPRLFAYDQLIIDETNQNITTTRTMPLPATIPGLGVYGGHFLVVLDNETTNNITNNYCIKVQTNRKCHYFFPSQGVSHQ